MAERNAVGTRHDAASNENRTAVINDKRQSQICRLNKQQRYWARYVPSSWEKKPSATRSAAMDSVSSIAGSGLP
jgi:hypothetical protein